MSRTGDPYPLVRSPWGRTSPAPDLSPAEAAFETAPTPPEVREAAADLLLEEVRETIGLGALVAKARREGLYCCSVGCGSGGCETCPCCCAGWCVSGMDGLPEAADDLAIWLEIAGEHNPAAAAVAAYRAAQDGDLHTRMAAVADNLDYYAGKTTGGTAADGLADAAGHVRDALDSGRAAQDGGAEEAVRRVEAVATIWEGVANTWQETADHPNTGPEFRAHCLAERDDFRDRVAALRAVLAAVDAS